VPKAPRPVAIYNLYVPSRIAPGFFKSRVGPMSKFGEVWHSAWASLPGRPPPASDISMFFRASAGSAGRLRLAHGW